MLSLFPLSLMSVRINLYIIGIRIAIVVTACTKFCSVPGIGAAGSACRTLASIISLVISIRTVCCILSIALTAIGIPIILASAISPIPILVLRSSALVLLRLIVQRLAVYCHILFLFRSVILRYFVIVWIIIIVHNSCPFPDLMQQFCVRLPCHDLISMLSFS